MVKEVKWTKYLSLALLYSFNLLNGIGFMKDFRAASPQRGSWQSQRRGRAASPVMIGADWKSTEIIRCPQDAPGRAQCTTSLSGV